MQRYLIQQKIQPLVNQYTVYQSNEAGQPGTMVAFAQQKRLTFKEQFTMYSNDSKTQVAFTMRARQVIDFGARYDIRDANDQIIGTVGKAFASSLLRSTWQIFAPGQEDKPLIIAQERSQGLAIVRRLWDFLPIIGDIPFFVKYHFDFTNTADGQVVASYEKTTTVRDHYLLTLQDSAESLVDPRVFISLGILMDAMQSR